MNAMPAGPDLAERLLARLRETGFDDAAVLPLREAGDERYAEWIARGWHGGLAYLERHAPIKRDPARRFPEYQSLVVVQKEYAGNSEPSRDPRIGNISRYALGDDYHDVMKRMLFRAADQVRESFPGLACRAFVDTGPLNEKLIAARAGLGSVGKHTNLLDRRRGSWFFLGLLLVGADLGAPARSPEPDRCGVCDACITACPTGAIVAPYRLDARRCISWLTIEQRGPIPREFRRAMGNRIFGCDDCQEVCPWNRFARRDPPESFRAREGLRDTDLADWLRLTIDEWRRIFRHSAVKRAGYIGFLRNCLVAAGNAREPMLAPAIRPLLEHEDALLRGHAAWALGELGRPEEGGPLARRLDLETDAWAAEEIRAALATLSH